MPWNDDEICAQYSASSVCHIDWSTGMESSMAAMVQSQTGGINSYKDRFMPGLNTLFMRPTICEPMYSIYRVRG